MELIGDFSFLVILVIMIFYAWNVLRAKDRSKIWSPLSFVLLTYVYYIILPYMNRGDSIYGLKVDKIRYYAVLGALIHLIFFVVGMSSVRCKNVFRNFNSLINEKRSKKIAIALFVLSLLVYLPYGGLRVSIFTQSDDVSMLENAGGLSNYALSMIAGLTVSCAILFMNPKKNKWWLLLFSWITIVTYIIGGFRYRLVIWGIAICSAYYLYDLRRRIRLGLILPPAIIAFFLFAAIEGARQYGNGLDYDKFMDFSLKGIIEKGGAGENKYVYEFSTLAMANASEKDLVLFEPLWCAVTMPIPRSVFLEKPNADYLRKAQNEVLGTDDMGAAMFNFVEGYMSFGWLGVCLYGYLFGIISGMYWKNYRCNCNSYVAILMLSVYNGYVYFVISRGYLAGSFFAYVFYMLVPYWVIMLYNRLIRILKGKKKVNVVTPNY